MPGVSGNQLTPRWVRAALLIGAGLGIGWAAFLCGFMSEPSADARSKAVLVVWAGVSIASAALGLIGIIGLLRRNRSGRPVAWAASFLMTASCVGAIAGIPALIGLASSRAAVRP